MDTVTIVGTLSLLVLGSLSTALALWCKYKDGVIGHLALAAIAVVSLAIGFNTILQEPDTPRFHPGITALILAVTVFMLRHAARAWHFRNSEKRG